MKNSLVAFTILILFNCSAFSQAVGIGTATPDNSAMLDITANNKGLLIPRLYISSINAIINPAKGLLVFDSVNNILMVNTGLPAIPDWQPVSGNAGGWRLTGNSGINPLNNFLGTTDNQPLRFRINNIQAGELHPLTGNVFWGENAGRDNLSGFSNVAIGKDALKLNKDGFELVAIGDSALFNNDIVNPTPGVFAIANTAVGSNALFSNTFGSRNAAVGARALSNNTTGNGNSAYGESSLFFNTTGAFNTALGSSALVSNTVSNFNTAVGANALFLNTTGQNNTATGASSLSSNSTGEENTAMGNQSLLFNTIGKFNTAAGSEALFSNIGGNNNTALGNNTLKNTLNASSNTGIGSGAGTIFNLGSNNTMIGAGADANQDGLNNATAIGSGAIVDASNKVRIGNGAVTVIEGQVPFTTPSDGRYKYHVREDVPGLNFIMQLRPVTYQFDGKRFDEQQKTPQQGQTPAVPSYAMTASYEAASAIRRTGFIAQEVETAAMAAGYDFSGIIKPKTEKDHYGLSYESFVVPLVKAAQEQQQMIASLKSQNEELNKRVRRLEKIILSLNKQK
jgi:hypothetical protein